MKPFRSLLSKLGGVTSRDKCPGYVSENPPSGKQMVSKMLVIKKVSKEDPSTAFSAGFASAGVLPTNGSKAPIAGSSVYKNLVPKPAVAPTKVGQLTQSSQ